MNFMKIVTEKGKYKLLKRVNNSIIKFREQGVQFTYVGEFLQSISDKFLNQLVKICQNCKANPDLENKYWSNLLPITVLIVAMENGLSIKTHRVQVADLMFAVERLIYAICIERLRRDGVFEVIGKSSVSKDVPCSVIIC